MSPTVRTTLAALAGALAAAVTIIVVEMIAGQVYPLPNGFDIRDMAQLRARIFGMPPMAFAMILLGWILGTFVGGAIAVRIERERAAVVAGSVAAVILAGTIVNLIRFPHPMWVIIGALAGIPAAAILATRTAPAQRAG